MPTTLPESTILLRDSVIFANALVMASGIGSGSGSGLGWYGQFSDESFTT